MPQIQRGVQHRLISQRNFHQQAAKSLVRIMQAVVAKRHKPVLSFGYRFDAAACVSTGSERGIVETRWRIVARERVGKIFQIDFGADEREIVVRRFDANFGGQRERVRCIGAAGKKAEREKEEESTHI